MTSWFQFVTLLAADDPEGPSFLVTMMPLLLIFMLLFPIVVWPQRKEQQKREALLNSLKKNDRVVTVGGMIGTVATISGDGKEITLRVDDNTRIKFTRAGISHKLEDAEKQDASKPAG